MAASEPTPLLFANGSTIRTSTCGGYNPLPVLSSILGKMNRQYPAHMLIKHGSIYLLTRVIAGAINFSTIILYTHLLAPEEYGKYTLIIVTIGIINNIVTGSLCEGIVRFYPNYQSNPNRLFALTNTILLSSWILFAILSALVVLVLDKQWSYLVGLAILIFWFQSQSDVNLHILRIRLLPKVFVIISIFRAMSIFAIGGLCVWLGWGASGALIGYLTGVVISSLIGSRGNCLRIDFGALCTPNAYKLYVYTVPILINSLLMMLISFSDRFVINKMLGTAQVGIYSATCDITQQTLGVFLYAISNATTPLVLNAAHHNDMRSLSQYMRENFALIVSVGTCAVVLFWKFIPNLMVYVVGQSYHSNISTLMPLVACAALLYSLRTHHFALPLAIAYQSRRLIYGATMGLLINLPLNFLLISRFGLVGAGIAAVATQIVVLAITYVQSRLLMPTVEKSDLVRILMSGLLLTGLLHIPVPPDWVAQLIRLTVSVGVYLLALGIMNVAGWRQRLWR